MARLLQGRLGLGHGPVDHQVAVLTADNGSHAIGKQTLEGVFRRLLSADEKGAPWGALAILAFVGRRDRRRVERPRVVDGLGLVVLLAAAHRRPGPACSGTTIERVTSSSESAGAGSTITVAPGTSSRAQHEVRQRVLDVALDRPAERTGTHRRVPALLDQEVLGLLA